jgi:hypothetical protein
MSGLHPNNSAADWQGKEKKNSQFCILGVEINRSNNQLSQLSQEDIQIKLM